MLWRPPEAEASQARAQGAARPPQPQAPAQAHSTRTLAVGADWAALARGGYGARAVFGVLADHVITQHVAIVADTDLTDLGFPYFSVMVPDAVLYAGDWWDWGKRGEAGLSAAPELPSQGCEDTNAIRPPHSPYRHIYFFPFPPPTPPPFPKSLKAHKLICSSSAPVTAPRRLARAPITLSSSQEFKQSFKRGLLPNPTSAHWRRGQVK